MQDGNLVKVFIVVIRITMHQKNQNDVGVGAVFYFVKINIAIECSIMSDMGQNTADIYIPAWESNCGRWV